MALLVGVAAVATAVAVAVSAVMVVAAAAAAVVVVAAAAVASMFCAFLCISRFRTLLRVVFFKVTVIFLRHTVSWGGLRSACYVACFVEVR